MTDKIKKLPGKPAYLLGIVAWLIYAGMSIFGPRVNNYHLNDITFYLVQLSVILPLLLIWLTAIYGAANFKNYARMIKDSPDGQALNLVTNGLILLVISFIFQALLGVLPRFAVGTAWLYPVVFLRNHLPMVLALLSSIYICIGSYRLATLVKGQSYRRGLVIALGLYVIAAGWMTQFFYTHIGHSIANGVPNFALPGQWPFYAIALPYLLAWLLGVITVVNIATYIRNVRGAIYRAALRYLAAGLLSVITFATALQMLTFTNSAVLKLNFSAILSLVYLILVLYAAGFSLVAAGARKLVRIEAF